MIATEFVSVTKQGWLAAAFVLALAMPSTALAQGCVPHDEIDASVDELVAGIRANAGCSLPYLALKRAARDERSLSRIVDTYASVRTLKNGTYVDEQLLFVAAAAGDPRPAIAFYDRNAKSHSYDKSLLNSSCWIRGELNADLAAGLTYCDAAIAYRRQPWVLANRARVKLLLGDYSGARADYDEALGMKSFRGHFMRPEALYGRGIALSKLGEAATDDLAEATAARPYLPAVFEDQGLKP